MIPVHELELRDYQLVGVERLRDGIREGHRSQLLVAPTGAGKTAMAAYLMREAQRKGSRVGFVVDRVALVDQTSALLDRYGIDHGVVQAGHWRRRLYEPIQVCSAQTIEKRGFFPDLGLLIVDEAHCSRKATADLIRNRAGLRVIGLTATPFTKGLSELYSNLVNVATTNALVKAGHLVPLKMYAAVTPDMKGAKVVGGEWADAEVERRGMIIVGDIVYEWVAKTGEHFGGPVKTIVFAATVAHGQALCWQFQAAGYRFEQISYRDGNDERRRELIEEFRKPDSSIIGLVSCEVLTKGFDVPDVLCGIAARPYRKSLSSHIQQLGRVMRPASGKSFGLWLDHAGNVLRFHADTELVFAEGVQSLKDGALDTRARREPDPREVEELKCHACGLVMPPRVDRCPACGHERKRRSLEEAVPGEMVLVGGRQQPAVGKHAFLADAARVRAQLWALALNRKGGDVEAARRFAQAQHRNLYGRFYSADFAHLTPESPSAELDGLVRHHLIRWASRRKHVRLGH